MIDPHAHLRDWEQASKETIEHGLKVAYLAGLDAVFEMPNTNPALTSREAIEERIKLADLVMQKTGLNIFHGLYAGITADPKQIVQVVEAYYQLFPRVVGLKMFAGHSTGNMGIIKEEEQKLVYKTLSDLEYMGVLAVHCEKESLINNKIFDPEKPFTHTLARFSDAEVDSVVDQIDFADEADYRGILHICHISVPESLKAVDEARNGNFKFKITCGITPHHALMYDEMMDGKDGILLKMNPPLRNVQRQEYMFHSLFEDRIDWIETDHAPHTLKDKTQGKKVNEKWEGYASGIPVFPYYSSFISLLKEKGATQKLIDNLTHNNIINTFGLNKYLVKNTRRAGSQEKEDLKRLEKDLAKEYEFDAFEKLKQA